MKSIFGGIFLRFSAMIVLSFIGTLVTRTVLSRGGPESASRLTKLQLYDARTGYEHGGAPELAAYLARASEAYGMEVFLLDGSGKDLVSGVDRSPLLARQETSIQIPYLGHTAQRRTLNSQDQKYWLASLTERHFSVKEFLSYYTWTFLAILGLSWWIAMDLGPAVRKLRVAVERFGRGDLTAHIDSKRTDELGELARAFDHMSERIRKLLTFERRLLQDISHELRSPLARLSCAIELARNADNREEAVARIHKESRRLNSLVGQLLEVASAEGDPAEIRREAIQLDTLISDLLDECRIEAEAKDVHLAFAHTAPADVSGDRELLRRALENVIRNAIRYAPEHSVIHTGLTVENGLARIDIQDCGKGVPEEHLSDIFKPFFRVEAHRGDQSVGLGLALAQRAIGLHQGTVQAMNRAPGLLIRIELPAECGPLARPEKIDSLQA